MTHEVQPDVVDILLVEDDAGLQQALQDTLLLAGFSCAPVDNAEDAIIWLQHHAAKLVITDVQMAGMDGLGLLDWINRRIPGLPVLVMTAYAQVSGAVAAIRAGAVDYLAKPFTPDTLLSVVSRHITQPVLDDGNPVVGDASSIQLLQLATRVAESGASVMISGPSGTGKEVLARFIHQKSDRANAAFVAINCAAIPDNMLEATLFGYEKGAFTGAVQGNPGKFEQANGGTILLDEITEMDLNLQAKLLRVLQEREVERLGGRKTIALDVRVLATSNRDLRQAVADGRFREDLFYRLNVFPLHWPALAERPDDIVPLAEFLLQRYAKELGRGQLQLGESAKARLLTWQWPGNVRELGNVIQRALILAQSTVIEAQDILLDELLAPAAVPLSVNPSMPVAELAIAEAASCYAANESAGEVNKATATDLSQELASQEQQIIWQTLQEHGGSRQQVAEQLGISPRTLRYKLARMREAGMEV
ncbi:sigma-54-dependent Fis family transcriptional regulator [Oceanisphaera profunda]|uniref:Sigma-54-dependent Fis family transcriptional regulator n=1 Tax=Oceanisphaera profunda TaxID=1416627 RepID=A0A1Y0D752_9GAMM|nr:sigma-54 dependent transcriptional regulator [Oceanisphaera profunda]ART83373.1 sigma-54-dependent Fis family transcriptional regulator [Oceanisphaera profunda]